jgi:hypothetical protein
VPPVPDVTPAELEEALTEFRLAIIPENPAWNIRAERLERVSGTIADPHAVADALHRELGAYAARHYASAPDVQEATPGQAAHRRYLLGTATATPEREEALLRQVEAARDEAMAECGRLAGLLAAARGEHEAFLAIRGALEGERDEARALVRDILQALPDTAGEQEWRERAGAAGITDPDGEPYRAWTEEDL